MGYYAAKPSKPAREKVLDALDNHEIERGLHFSVFEICGTEDALPKNKIKRNRRTYDIPTISRRSKKGRISGFKNLIAAIREAERRLYLTGITDVAERVSIIRGLFYGTRWSHDFRNEQSGSRSWIFRVCSGDLREPINPQGILDGGLYEAIRDSQDVRDSRDRCIDFGHMIFGMEARATGIHFDDGFKARIAKIMQWGLSKTFQGTNLEIASWVGDIGAATGRLAFERAKRGNGKDFPISRVFSPNGESYGCTMNLEGDAGAYVCGNLMRAVSAAPYYPTDNYPGGSLADCLERYLSPGSQEWDNRAYLFLSCVAKDNGGHLLKRGDNTFELQNKDQILETVANKVAWFGQAYIHARSQDDPKYTPGIADRVTNYIPGASRETAQVFIDTLFGCCGNPGKPLTAAGPFPEPTEMEEGGTGRMIDLVDEVRDWNLPTSTLKDWAMGYVGGKLIGQRVTLQKPYSVQRTKATLMADFQRSFVAQINDAPPSSVVVAIELAVKKTAACLWFLPQAKHVTEFGGGHEPGTCVEFAHLFSTLFNIVMRETSLEGRSYALRSHHPLLFGYFIPDYSDAPGWDSSDIAVVVSNDERYFVHPGLFDQGHSWDFAANVKDQDVVETTLKEAGFVR